MSDELRGGVPKDIGYGRAACRECGQIAPFYVMGGLCEHRTAEGVTCLYDRGVLLTTAQLWALIDAQEKRIQAMRDRVVEALK